MSTNKTQEIIKNIIYSLVWIIGYFTIYLALFGNSTIGGIPLLILTLPVPILFGLTKIWMNYLKKIQKPSNLLRHSLKIDFHHQSILQKQSN